MGYRMPLTKKKKKKKKKESKIGYACGVDFNHEICDDNAHPIEIYGSIKALKHRKTSFNQCGIVKVKVTLEKWVHDQDFKDVK